MSNNENTGVAANGASPSFSERELQLLGWAMQSLKSGPPEIDYEKLAAFASMSNVRSASNAWAKIKLKLMTPSDGTVPATPKKSGARKNTVKEDKGEEGEGTPKKTPRKRTAKNLDVDGDASPKKKGRSKKASVSEANVKAESDDSQDLKLAGSPMKIDPANDNAEDEV